MKAVKFISALLLFMSSGLFVQAQSVDEIVKEWERAKTYTKEYLDAMPESGYAFKPTPDMRSFAEQILHLTDADYGIISAATGETPSAKDLEKTVTDKSKANITKIAMDGYDFAINSIRKLNPASLQEQIKLFGSVGISRKGAIDKAFEHQTHHRGQTTVYLRLAGVKPPQEKLF